MALKLLDGYRGIVQCDGYAAYKTIAAKAPGEAITLAFCWAHLRRGFFDLAKAAKRADRQRGARTHRRALCDREDDPRRERRHVAARRARTRASRSSPRSGPGFEQQLARVSAKASIAEEIRYGLNHWDGLTRFLDDGRIELDTNIVERGIRPIVLNRKNSLFAGHD